MVSLIRDYCVPVAIDLRARGGRPLPGSPANVQRQLIEQWGLDKHRPIGVYLLTADGKVLAGMRPSKDTGELLAWLEKGLRQLGPLPRRRPVAVTLNPDRGLGVRADGSARLAVTARTLRGGLPANQHPMFDSIFLREDEMRGLRPPRLQTGERYQIPETTSRHFVRALTDDGDMVFALRAQDATKAQLNAVVTQATADRVEVRIEGALAGKRPYTGGGTRVIEAEGTVRGLLIYSPRGELQQLLLVCDGTYRNPWASAAHTVGGLIEWRRATPQAANARLGKR